MKTVNRTLTLLPEQYAICNLSPETPVPAWALDHQASFCSVTRSPDELSIICPQAQTPVEIGASTGWRCLKLNGPIGLDEPGVLASMVTPLAEAGVSVFAVATYDTDYLLVQKLDTAIAALEKAACSVSLPWPLPCTEGRIISREVKEQKSAIRVGDLLIGDGGFVVMAGPCAVETREQLLSTADAAAAAGAKILRGGAYKPRTSPYDFQGLGEVGLKLLAEARARSGLKVITEVVDTEDTELVAEYADILQVGARNMQNFALLKKLGAAGKPVMLKRGLSATIKEFLLAAEYIVTHGNPDVILCERGIRTFETATRNTLDLAAVPLLNELSHLPVIVDPSHGTGKRSLIRPLAKAAVAVGADGLMTEVHPCPEEAWSDGPQSLRFSDFAALMRDIKPYIRLRRSELRTRNHGVHLRSLPAGAATHG